MWFLFSLIAAVFYAALWVLGRMSRGMSAGYVLVAQSATAPILIALALPIQSPIPWSHPLWTVFLVMEYIVAPILFLGMTYAGQRSHISVIKPLSGLSAMSALFFGIVFFDDVVSLLGALSVLIVVLGLLMLYKGRMHHWQKPYPWIVLGCVILFGFNGALFRATLQIFPEPLLLTGLFFAPTGALGVILLLCSSVRIGLNARHWWILGAFAVANCIQEIATVYALSLAPSAYMFTVKRTSIIIASLIGYFYFHEKEVPLWRLIVGSLIVISGTGILAMIH